jgi:hypothetical protein
LVALLALVLGVGSASAVAPTVSSITVSAVTAKSAVLEAEINPEGEATTYRFEYGTADCASNPCTAVPVTEGNVGSGSSTVKVVQEVEALIPSTTYHFRVVANNASGPAASLDRTFNTYAPPSQNTNCPNQAFRTGLSATLPDCRAYEMVSPVDKNGGDITTVCNSRCFRTAFNQSSLDGNKITYSSYKAFGDAMAGPYSSQYLATRGKDGWATHGLSPRRKTGLCPNLCGYSNLDVAFKDFTDDLSSAWLYDNSETALTGDALQGSANIYRRDNIDDGYEPLTINELASPPSLPNYDEPEMQGHTSNGAQALFISLTALTPDAASSGQYQLYDSFGGKLHLVSVLPDGTADPDDSAAGTNNPGTDATHGGQSLNHAISGDGSRVYWSSSTFGLGEGDLYLRKNPVQEESARLHGSATGAGDVSSGSNEVMNVSTATGSFESGQEISGSGIPAGTTVTSVTPTSLALSANATDTVSGIHLSATSPCTEPAKACTVHIDSSAQFWTASADGSRMLFSSLGTPFGMFDADTETTTQLAGQLVGVLGASNDLSYIYFVSQESLAPGGIVGEPNLYLDHEGTKTFIATLSSLDTGGGQGTLHEYNIVSPDPLHQSVRVTPDGRHVVLQSTQTLTGYDNAAVNNGEPAVEIYAYDADTAQIACISCNPAGARPFAKPLDQPYRAGQGEEHPYSNGGGPLRIWTAAWLPTAGSSLHTPRALSDDGSRVFFNSFDALVPQDTNGAQDVYQWEQQGTGDCEKPGGCVNLISTGQSPQKSEFVDATPDGSNVFFETTSSIVPQDQGLIDIYDSREEGGFPPPPPPPPPCVGDACQSAPPAPNDPTPASAGFRGAGDTKVRLAGSCGGQSNRASKLRRRATQLSHRAQHTDTAVQAEALRKRAGQLTWKAEKLSKRSARCKRTKGRARR